MGLFSRQPKFAEPENLGAMLAEWGRWEFEPSSRPQFGGETSEFVLGLQLRRDPEERAGLIDAIRETGLREGGWTAYGAWDAISFLEPVPEETLRELSEARVRFLLGLGDPDLPLKMNGFDMETLQRIDPERYRQLSPG